MKILRTIISIIITIALLGVIVFGAGLFFPEAKQKVLDVLNVATTEASEKYTEAVVEESVVAYEVDTLKSCKSFSAKLGDSSVSGNYYEFNKDENGNYLIYVVGQEAPVSISPDRVEVGDYRVENVTKSILREYEDGRKQVTWKTDLVLYLPSGSIVK